MMRTTLILLLASSVILAQGRGRRAGAQLLQEALDAQMRPGPGQTEEDALDRAFLMMGKAIEADPDLEEAYFHRGFNRCLKNGIVRGILEQRLNTMRAEGYPEEDQAATREAGQRFIDAVLNDAYENFRRMARIMKKEGTWDQDKITFTRAATKFAAGEYLKAKEGAPGAIDEFKTLMKRNWNQELCADLIARSYMQLGATAFTNEDFATAQDHWDAGLRWAVSPPIRRTLLTNKAGAYEMDNQFERAEQVLRKLIRSEPDRPEHWKNLGLVLGYQNHLHTALYAYRQSREWCEKLSGDFPLGMLHGNSWLKAAMIHGKLLEADGDLRRAWRLFLGYRAMFGDDYNFCINFGEFCYQMGQYELAWTFLENAAEIHPFCPNPHQLMLSVAQRMTDGTPEERLARREKAKADLQRVRDEYSARVESPALKRLCGGLRDLGDGPSRSTESAPIVPDPLLGETAENPPLWIVKAAEQRDDYVEYDPTVEQFLADTAKASEAAAKKKTAEPKTDAATEEASGRPWWHWAVVGGGALVLLVGIRRLRRRPAA